MSRKKYLIFAIVVAAVAVIGIFLAGNSNKTFYIKNDSPYLANLHPNSNYKPIADNVGDLSNTIIPSIKIPKNLTEDFAGFLARGIISKNSEPQAGDFLPGPGMNVPNPSEIAEKYIKDGLKRANENILNVKPAQFKILSDNGQDAIAVYLSEAQIIINKNLNAKDANPIAVLKDLGATGGAEIQKLLPVITAYETAANQLENKPIPSSLIGLMSEEIRLLRITANVLKAITDIETDPLAAITATKQLGAVMDGWADLQKKFNLFIQKLNRA